MSYIGRKPTVGNFQICDAISVVNGQAAYTMQVGSVNVLPETANHMIVSLNGVIQAPISSYTVSGSTITFSSNLATGDVIDFIQILGDVLDLGVPSDATVTTAKIVDGAITSAKLGSGVGGKVLQVVTDVFSTETGTTSTSYVAVSGFAATITPSSTSSKILVLCSASSYINAADAYLGTIYRGATDLGTFGRLYSTAGGLGGFISFNYLDSPSTTSATTYTYYHKVGSGTGYVSVNNYKSNLTLLEIAG